MGLFSTTHIHQGKTELVPYCKQVNVTEKKAPTDESIRLLNEMQEKSKQNIIATIKIEENFLKGIAVYFQDDFVADRINYYIRFELNGKKYDIKSHLDRFEWNEIKTKQYIGLYNQVIFDHLIREFSEKIASELLLNSHESLKEMLK